MPSMQFIAVGQAIKSMKITPKESIDQGYVLYQQLPDTLKRTRTP